jgi:hypothetical protein
MPRGDDQIYFPDMARDFVTACGLTPADTYMLVVDDFLLLGDEPVTGKSHDEVLRTLADWRESKGDDLRFLWCNPSSGTPIEDWEEMRYVFLSLYPSAQGGVKPTQVLIDVRAQQIHVAAPGHALTSPQRGTVAKLSADAWEKLVALLERRVTTWPEGDYYSSRRADGGRFKDWRPSGYGNWDLALCAGDYSVHRVEGISEDGGAADAPADFADFMAEFSEIVGVAL